MPLIIFFMYFMSSAFAILPHEGGGGNICVSERSKRLVVIDSLATRKFGFFLNRPEELGLNLIEGTQYYQTDLTKLRSSKFLLTQFRKYEDIELGSIFERLLMNFNRVYVTDKVSRKPLEEDLNLERYCVPGTARVAFLTHHGFHVISRTDWRQLDSTNQSLLIRHEVVRNLQLLIGLDYLSSTRVSTWANSISESWLLSRNDDFALTQVKKKLELVRKQYPRRKLKEFMSALERKLYAKIEKDDHNGAYLILKEIQLVDLAHSANRSQKPLYFNLDYVKYFEAKFAEKMKADIYLNN